MDPTRRSQIELTESRSGCGAAPHRQKQNPRYGPALDALNFWLADVRGGLGPYLNVFLVTERHWSQSEVGLVTTMAGVIALAFQTPAGALIDSTKFKRGLIVAALAVLALGGLTIYALPSFWPVCLANAAMALVGDVFGPAVGALTLGVWRTGRLARRFARNAAFDHAGNVAIASLAGLAGWAASQRAVFLLAPLCAIGATIATLSIPARAIDHARARGGQPADTVGNGNAQSLLKTMLENRGLRVFALCTLLFHFANAPLLPLVGQKLALAHKQDATAMMSACIIAAQAIMLPVAVLVGRSADRIGRKPILLLGFAVLPLRALLYTASDNAAWLIGVQLLDGVGAGILGAISPLVIADLMRGTGRFNLAQGAVATCQGIGASFSGLAIGEIVDRFGYTAGFVQSAVCASIALSVLAYSLPETRTASGVRPGDTRQALPATKSSSQ